MLSLPQTLTTNAGLLNGEAAPGKGFGADTAAASGSPGFADTLRATARVPQPAAAPGDASGNPLPQQGKALPHSADLPVTGPIKLPAELPDGLALADVEASGLDLPRLLNRFAERPVLPVVAHVNGTTDAAIAQAGVPAASLFAAVDDAALTAGLAAPAATQLAPMQGWVNQLPVTVAVNPADDAQALNAPLVTTSPAAMAGATERAAPPALMASRLPLTQESLTTRVAERSLDLMRPFGAFSGNPLPGPNQQGLPLARQGAASARASGQSGTEEPPALRATQGMAPEPGNAALRITRDPVASAIAQQLTTPVVRADSVAQDLQRGAAVRPIIAATPQSAAAMTAINDALHMAQPTPAQQPMPAAVLQPRADGATTPVLNPVSSPLNEARTAPPQLLPNGAAVSESLTAPVTAAATAPAPAPVASPAPVSVPVAAPRGAAAMPGTVAPIAETVTAESVAATAKADVQAAAPTPTIAGAAAAPALPGLAATSSPAAALPPINLPVADSAWGDALSERVVVLAGQKLTSADIRLNPAELGPLRVEIKVDDGNTQIHFTAQHAVTREAIEQALPRLRELLSAEGLNLTGADVSEHGVGRDHGEQAEAAGGDAVAQDDAGSAELDSTADTAAPARTGDSLVDTFA